MGLERFWLGVFIIFLMSDNYFLYCIIFKHAEMDTIASYAALAVGVAILCEEVATIVIPLALLSYTFSKLPN